ncbi:MAG: ABC transporter ATP-binding protein [Armatimonadetes bacterium]|nr:ABC transporter ATP-binding protein [Armatimonadota bacterium]
MGSRKRLTAYLATNKWRFIGGAFFSAGVAGINLYTASLLKRFLDATMFSSWHEVCIVAILFAALQIPKGLASFGQHYLLASATNHIAAAIRDDVYSHLHRMSLNFFERNKIGHLMSRMTNDVGLIQNGSGAVLDAVAAPMMVIGGISYMFKINWILALVAVVFAPGMSIVISRITRRMRKLTMTLQFRLADVAAVLEETLAGIRIVKSFGMEKHEVRRFADQNRASLMAALKGARRSAAVTPVTEFVGALAVCAVVLVGGYLVVEKMMTLGDLTAFAFISFHVASSAKAIGRLNVTYHQAMAGVERIFEILDEQPDLSDAPDAIELDEVEGWVEFRDVSFSYQTGEEVLSGISFTMEPGKVVALVGPSGAGKSTIANVIPRFYDVTGGAVLVDGSDVRKVTASSLRRHIGIVPQETVLFSGTIRDNIAYGRPDATDQEIEEAARAANAHDFIAQFEQGYNTIIGERGVRLSGGERQRVSIARAILKDPRILILDEATSSLDSTSERLVQEALEVLMRGRTTLVIAHRLSTITSAHKIIVLAGGKIVEQGSFDELMEREGMFARLYRAQFDVQAFASAAGAGGPGETSLEKSQD